MEIISRREAISAGLERYYTGKRCLRGHIAERRTDSASCIECSLGYYAENREKILSIRKGARNKQREERILIEAEEIMTSRDGRIRAAVSGLVSRVKASSLKGAFVDSVRGLKGGGLEARDSELFFELLGRVKAVHLIDVVNSSGDMRTWCGLANEQASIIPEGWEVARGEDWDKWFDNNGGRETRLERKRQHENEERRIYTEEEQRKKREKEGKRGAKIKGRDLEKKAEKEKVKKLQIEENAMTSIKKQSATSTTSAEILRRQAEELLKQAEDMEAKGNYEERLKEIKTIQLDVARSTVTLQRLFTEALDSMDVLEKANEALRRVCGGN